MGPTPFNNNANINREFNYLTIWCLPGLPGENNRPAAGHRQTLSYNVV